MDGKVLIHSYGIAGGGYQASWLNRSVITRCNELTYHRGMAKEAADLLSE